MAIHIPRRVEKSLSIFSKLINGLKPFIKTDDLKLAFNSEQEIYIIGDDFQESLNINSNNFPSDEEFENLLRSAIAKHRSQRKPSV